MLNCRQATRLISQSMDATLPWHRRLAMRFHLLYCVWCRRYSAQLQLVRKAARELSSEALPSEEHKLSSEAKDHIRARLQDALREPPSSSQ